LTWERASASVQIIESRTRQEDVKKPVAHRAIQARHVNAEAQPVFGDAQKNLQTRDQQ